MAPLSVQKTLSQLFVDISKNTGMVDDKSLVRTLDFCTDHFRGKQNKKSGNALDIWYMIGLQGPGILYDDMKIIYNA